MSRRTLGYVENEWTCPNCSTRNKGSVKTCGNCGAPQPENVQFVLPSEQKYVKEEAAIAAAKAEADIHCGFCGTRNPVTADTCSQCGGDLKEGRAREAGRVMQTPPPAPKVLNCANCGTENPSSNSNCSNCGSPLPKKQTTPPQAAQPVQKPAEKKKTNWLLIGGIIAVVAVCCIAIGALLLIPSKSVDGTVSSVHWQTNVPVEELQAVDYSDQAGSAPSNAYNVSCHDESQDVCEQYTVDKGNGYSEVVEECHTETQEYCSYTVDEWRTIQTYTLEGNDLQPIYDSPSYTTDQRLGSQSEDLTVTFTTEGGIETYSPDTITEFQKFVIGSVWTLKLNSLGGVVSVEP